MQLNGFTLNAINLNREEDVASGLGAVFDQARFATSAELFDDLEKNGGK